MDMFYGTCPEVGGIFIKKELDSDEIDIECHSPEDMCPDVSIQDLLDGGVKLPGVSDVLIPSKRSARVVCGLPAGERHQCRACPRSYKHKCHLSRHVRQKHCSALDPARLLRCHHCSYFTQRKSSMVKHISRWHTGRPATLQVRRSPRLIMVPAEGPPLPHACNSCSKSYDHAAALQRHTRLECGISRVASYRSLRDKKATTVPSTDADLPLPVFIKLEVLDKPGIDDPGLDDPGLDDPGFDDPALDGPGLDDPELNDPGFDDLGLDGPRLDDPGVPSSMQGCGRPRSPKVYRERYRMHCCPTCSQRLRHKGSLALHAKYGCGANRHFKKCAHCDYCTNQARRMEHHLGTHHAELCYPDRATPATIFKCSVCHRRLLSEASLISHRRHRCRGYRCTHCAYLGHSKQNLTSHVANNHPKLPRRAAAPPAHRHYQCNVCLRCYKNLGDVNRHARLCGTNPQYPCAGCGRTYRHQYALDRHLALECGRAPHLRCPHCPFRTKRAFSLKLHIGKKHS